MKKLLIVVVFLLIKQSYGQQTSNIDFVSSTVSITVDAEQKAVSGTVIYNFNVLKAVDSIFIDAQQMQFYGVLIDGKSVKVYNDTKKLWLIDSFGAGADHQLTLKYRAHPKKALYFSKDYQGNDQIWTQGQGKYTSNWLPSFDDMNEKVIFDLSIRYKKEYEVIANGKLTAQEPGEGMITWKYDMIHPMSSYLVAFVIGKYDKKTTFAHSGVPLTFYYYPQDANKFEPTYRYSKQLFDFLESKIGVPYPWQNYKQIPVKDFLYAGMENTGTTIFSDAFVVDSTAFVDRTYSNVNAHELAHQWFGNLITAKEGKHHWLQEGFATYYALLAEREVLGEEYFYYKLYESAEQLDAQSKSATATAVLDEKASSLTFYQRGAWALHALKNKLSDTIFDKVVKDYLLEHQFKNVTTADFIKVAEGVSGQDLSAYQALWLEGVSFPSKEALVLLEQSPFIKNYLNLAKERTQPFAGKIAALDTALDFPINEYIAQEAVYQLEGSVSPQAIVLYKKAFETNDSYVRQAIATTLSKIPALLKEEYEDLLSDPSYATQEAALYHLWSNYPAQRKAYLEQMKNATGFNDKNIRILWLVLAISTENFEENNKKAFFEELSSYTASTFSNKVRENAFTYLESLQLFSDQVLCHLVDAATHYEWRFRNSSRTLLDKLLLEERYQKKFVALKEQLPKHQQKYIEQKLLVQRGK